MGPQGTSGQQTLAQTASVRNLGEPAFLSRRGQPKGTNATPRPRPKDSNALSKTRNGAWMAEGCAGTAGLGQMVYVTTNAGRPTTSVVIATFVRMLSAPASCLPPPFAL